MSSENEKIAEIRERLANATGGPWRLDSDNWIEGGRGRYVVAPDENTNPEVVTKLEMSDENAELIVNAPEDIAFLLSYIKELEQGNE